MLLNLKELFKACVLVKAGENLSKMKYVCVMAVKISFLVCIVMSFYCNLLPLGES